MTLQVQIQRELEGVQNPFCSQWQTIFELYDFGVPLEEDISVTNHTKSGPPSAKVSGSAPSFGMWLQNIYGIGQLQVEISVMG